jgi:hypothetical protein
MIFRGPAASQGRPQKSPWNAELRERGRTWNSEIAAVRLPSSQWADEGGSRSRERRFLGHGGLLINLRNGAWYSHSHQDGGYSPLGLLRFIDDHCQPDTPLAGDSERIEWALAFLANHPGEGPCNGTLEGGEGTAAEGASRIKAERVLRDLVRLDHPDAEPGRTYFAGRQIPVPEPLPDWHANTVGFLPHTRVGEHAIVTLQRANQRIVSVNLRFIDALGKKSAVSPAFARYKLEAGATGVMEFPAAPGVTPTETVIAEGSSRRWTGRRSTAGGMRSASGTRCRRKPWTATSRLRGAGISRHHFPRPICSWRSVIRPSCSTPATARPTGRSP